MSFQKTFKIGHREFTLKLGRSSSSADDLDGLSEHILRVAGGVDSTAVRVIIFPPIIR